MEGRNYVMCACRREMAPGGGCALRYFSFGEEIHKRIKFGEEVAGMSHMAQDSGNCHDCNAAAGRYHHDGCDTEECPRCGQQSLGCDCGDEFEGDMFAFTNKGV